MTQKQKRDTEAEYSNEAFVEKLRRLADAIEGGDRFEIMIDGERIYIPKGARLSVEHEREGQEEEVEFQIRWTNS